MDYSELLAYFALIMMLISKYGLCRSSVRNYANHDDGVPDPNTLICNYQSCHVSRLRCRNPAMCLSLKTIFNILFCYLAIDRLKYYKSLWNIFHLFVMNSFNFPHRTFLHLRCFKRINLLFRLLLCLLHFQVIKCLSALFC